MLDHGISVETGQHGERTFRDQDLIVVSPGVPFDVPQLVHARERGIPVIGEVELAARFLKGHIVAITGSNGKTTTTTLAGDIIAAGGRKTLVGGNIGTPAITFVDRATDDTWLVLEISSFQLETIETFHPQIAVVLNITPDHLDRHHTFENYAGGKGAHLREPDRERFRCAECRQRAVRRPGCPDQGRGVLVQPPGGSRSRSVRPR